MRSFSQRGIVSAALVAAWIAAPAMTLADNKAHGTMDPKIVKCHEEHAKLVASGKKMDAANMDHMKGCHDKDGKLIGNADGHMKHMDHSGHQ